ncbi:MAG: DUF262 domain-containing protein, partial [Candidatus Marinimicrobia bacterium]|nr:DUF262 domain-containing protein [Candidatus Neomarinimicrobiota bacterium]
TTLFKDVTYSLNKLIQDIEIGEIGLPELQRPFVWTNAKVRDLFDSMYKGFPVGYLLFWANGIGEDHRQIGANTKQKVPRLLIVDGQQRLTSLYAVLRGIAVVRENYKTERIYIAFRPKDQKFEVADAAIRRDPEWIPDISQLWSGSVPRHRYVKDFLAKLKEKTDYSDETEDMLFESIDQLYDLQAYPFTALELSRTVNEQDVADVFVRINSQGTLLNQSDFILTLMSVFWDEGRTELESFSRESRIPSESGPSPYNIFLQPDPDHLLRTAIGLGFKRARLHHVYNILRGKDLETREFSDERRTKQFKILKEAQTTVLDVQNWHDFFKSMLAAGYRRSDMISSKMAVVYAYTFYLIGKIDYKVDPYLLRNLIARWMFMSSMTGRYSGSPESIMEQDLNRLRGCSDGEAYINLLDTIITETLTDDFWDITLPNKLASTAARGPSLFAYYAALNLLGARGLFSNIKVSDLIDSGLRAKKSPLERHHLFPKAHLAKTSEFRQQEINQIANYALVEWQDNIAISDMAPAEYLSKYLSRFNEEEKHDMYYWHALPDGWENMEYLQFLDERRRLMAKVTRNGFETLSSNKNSKSSKWWPRNKS